MNPHKRFPYTDPREWMNRARSDLTLAKSQIPGVYLEDLCFNAQQAAEKAIKAVMIARDIEFPYVHDLDHLLSLLEKAGEVIPEAIWRATDLTNYATITRYPADIRPVNQSEYQEAIAIAATILRWAEERIL